VREKSRILKKISQKKEGGGGKSGLPRGKTKPIESFLNLGSYKVTRKKGRHQIKVCLNAGLGHRFSERDKSTWIS